MFKSQREVKFVDDLEAAPIKEKDQKNPAKTWMIYRTAQKKNGMGKEAKVHSQILKDDRISPKNLRFLSEEQQQNKRIKGLWYIEW